MQEMSNFVKKKNSDNLGQTVSFSFLCFIFIKGTEVEHFKKQVKEEASVCQTQTFWTQQNNTV